MIWLEQGWIKLHRTLIEKPIWKCSTQEQKVILITLLLMANHKPNEWEWNGQKYTLQSGEFITSLKSIAEKAGSGISIQNVRTAIDKFEKYEFLTNKSTNKNRLITIVNWEFYQSKDNESTNKLTSDQQATNKQLTTNKNVKNNKNVIIKHKHGVYEHVFLKDMELDKLNSDYGENETKAAIKYLDEYIEMKGTNYKNHYLVLRKWVFEAVKKQPQVLSEKIKDQEKGVDCYSTDYYKQFME